MSDDQTAGKHPAIFTESIIERLAILIPKNVPFERIIHDPFAGEGVRLGALCDALGYTFTGTDLERWQGSDTRVALGDSTLSGTYPTVPYAIVTSPTYNNGVNDHFDPKDDSKRLTYRVRAGHELHPNNTGRWSGRGSKKGEAEYWRLTRNVVTHWPNIAIVNVKDSVRSTWEGGIYPLVRLWTELHTADGTIHPPARRSVDHRGRAISRRRHANPCSHATSQPRQDDLGRYPSQGHRMGEGRQAAPRSGRTAPRSYRLRNLQAWCSI
jgi:hypothetical protein